MDDANPVTVRFAFIAVEITVAAFNARAIGRADFVPEFLIQLVVVTIVRRLGTGSQYENRCSNSEQVSDPFHGCEFE